MKFQTAMDIIQRKPGGYMVSFEHLDNKMLSGDHFPDKHAGEQLIPTEEEAWKWANLFARKTHGSCINIHVVDSDFDPVTNYRERMIINRR